LLHASQRGPINVKVLPEWMQQPSQLLVASDSCLLHFELPFQAMALARKAAELQGTAFSELDFYRSAARRSGTSRPHLATACLALALACISETDIETRLMLEFDTFQIWLDSENYGLAAGYARKIRNTYADHPEMGRAIWLYHYALSRDGNAKDILADIDTAIADTRCVPYRARLLYIKWWALRRQRDQQARLEVLEVALLKEYGTDPMVAPILLSRATDALARQDYDQARTTLADLIERFPQTKAASQAQRMLDKLRAIDGVKEGQP
jgi:outer membrane protein assembly factor BamD (BamD/ComL family)